MISLAEWAFNVIVRHAFRRIEKSLVEESGYPQRLRPSNSIPLTVAKYTPLVEHILEQFASCHNKISDQSIAPGLPPIITDPDYRVIVAAMLNIVRNDYRRLADNLRLIGLPVTGWVSRGAGYALNRMCSITMRRCDEFLKYHRIILDPDNVARVYFNSLSFSLYAPCLGADPMPTNDAGHRLMALATLHPLIDSVFDSKHASRDTIRALRGILYDEDQQLPDELLGVSSLLRLVIEGDPNAYSSELALLLRFLFDWQVESMRQQIVSGEISARDLLAITLHKGGLTFSSAIRIIMPDMNERTARSIFATGALFQLVDDWQDIRDDLRDGVRTVFTEDYRINGNIDRSVRFVSGLQQWMEENLFGGEPVTMRKCFEVSSRISPKIYMIRMICLHWDKLSEPFKAELATALGALNEELFGVVGKSYSYLDLTHHPIRLLLRV
jgi:hypothetical protein